ncbi:MAG: DNA polymerase/3'-5' exonuclease PolX [Opitutales bacterium]|nr:DNA polymerase/3'-5' exonuclease PolX [Opitutales bacterium]MCH8540546.1 DNA polymerase/3'-5' exonuclease PolX [Opitutales bacterium]
MVTKNDIIGILEEIGVILEIKGENPFKTRAYANAARTLEGLEEDFHTLVAEERLDQVKGIGKAIAEKISRLVNEGDLPYYNDLKASIPPGLLDMLDIPGMGPKKIKAVHKNLNISNIEELKASCEEGKLQILDGFGKKTEEKILKGIQNREAYMARHLWWEAHAIAKPLVEALRELPEVEKAEIAGSLRRKKETVGDLDFLASSGSPAPIMDWFTKRPEVQEVTTKGETKASVRLTGGLQADLRVVPPEQYAFALHHFTGSKEHNVALRSRSLQKGYSLSEWGLKSEKANKAPQNIFSEEDLFEFLGLPLIPPELREGREEIERLEGENPPLLIEESDLKGVFHNHTKASDGQSSLREMAHAAAKMGWEYLGISDHSKASFQADGLNEEKLIRQIAEIREYNASPDRELHLFAGIECDILSDGSLDFEDEVLAECDYVIAAIHSRSGQKGPDETARLIAAMENPLVTMIAHPTGRLLLQREPYDLDHRKIIDAAAGNGVVIEINSHPRRLDMDWRWWRYAREKGVRASINPDAHHSDHFAYTLAGINIARKGWLQREDVINTMGLKDVSDFLRKKMSHD